MKERELKKIIVDYIRQQEKKDISYYDTIISLQEMLEEILKTFEILDN